MLIVLPLVSVSYFVRDSVYIDSGHNLALDAFAARVENEGRYDHVVCAVDADGHRIRGYVQDVDGLDPRADLHERVAVGDARLSRAATENQAVGRARAPHHAEGCEPKARELDLAVIPTFSQSYRIYPIETESRVLEVIGCHHLVEQLVGRPILAHSIASRVVVAILRLDRDQTAQICRWLPGRVDHLQLRLSGKGLAFDRGQGGWGHEGHRVDVDFHVDTSGIFGHRKGYLNLRLDVVLP